MKLFVLFLVVETLTWVVIYRHFYRTSGKAFYFSSVLNLILSIWLWTIFARVQLNTDGFATPWYSWLSMNLMALVCAVAVPRLIIVVFHFTGIFLKIRNARTLTWTGMALSVLMSLVIAIGVFHGRFNIKTDNITLPVKDLPANMDGFKIVQISDLHLPTFYNHLNILDGLMDEINEQQPDLLINTGDFVNISWQEFGRNDTILSKAKGSYGSFAVLGNHDIGTYHPGYDETDYENNIARMNELITASGYRILTDENIIIDIEGSKIALIGVITKGRHPVMIHGNLEKAMSGADSADLKILLAHDPNQWTKDVRGKTDIDLTLSGHTHGMQMGILTKNFRWSPSIFFYPHWGGLFCDGDQYHYVNRGLGVLAIPFRIWMPAEITVITLTQKKE